MNQQTQQQQQQPEPIRTPCQRTIVAMASHSGLKPETMSSLMACPFGDVSITVGISDTALARNAQIDAAVQRVKRKGGRPPDLLLMIDDDVVFTLGQVELLLCYAHNHGVPVSAVYMVGPEGKEKPAASRIPDPENCPEGEQFYVTGLGLLAIPWHFVERLNNESLQMSTALDTIACLTWSAPASDPEWDALGRPEDDTPRPWVSEDYRLCLRLGGVHCIPIPIGHVKTRVIRPPGEDVTAPEKSEDEPAQEPAELEAT